MPADAAMGAAAAGPSSAASVVTSAAAVVAATRATSGKRMAATPDTDSPTPVAPGTMADRQVPGHRLDTGQPTAGSAAHASGAPAGLGMMGTDRVAKVREQVAARPMQRLSIELDDARVAIRVRGDKVSVDVTSDPKGALGDGWARQVERTIDRAAKAQDTETRGSTPDGRPGSQGRRQPQQQQPHRRFEIDALHFAPIQEEEP
jgi:hypothetical protein